jgi:hypothetical protein
MKSSRGRVSVGHPAAFARRPVKTRRASFEVAPLAPTRLVGMLDLDEICPVGGHVRRNVKTGELGFCVRPGE